MKRIIAVVLCLITLTMMCVGCGKKEDVAKSGPSPSTKDVAVSASAGAFTAPATFGSGSPLDNNTTLPDNSALPGSTSPTDGASPTATAVPTATPYVTLRPAQKTSIVPPALLNVGYITPAEQPPAGYNMPYFVEVDITNQCINIYVRDAAGQYAVLLNRFIISAGSSSQPSLLGRFYLKSEAQQMAATGQHLRYYSYYFKTYQSYAYYITRYCNAYMFHSFTFTLNKSGQIVPKSAYNNMGNPGSAGCLRMLMGHAKWIYYNLDPGTYMLVTRVHGNDPNLRSTLKKYLPPLGYDMTPSWTPGSTTGLTPVDEVQHPRTGKNVGATPTPSPIPTAEPIITPTPQVTATATATAAVTATATATAENTPSVTPTAEVTAAPTPTTEAGPTPTATSEAE